MKFNIVTNKVRANLYISSALNLPGCHTQGSTRKIAQEHLREAIRAYIKSFQKHNEKLKIKNQVSRTTITLVDKVSIPQFFYAVRKMGFAEDVVTKTQIVMRNYNFPFQRIIVPADYDICHELIVLYTNLLRIPFIPSEVSEPVPDTRQSPGYQNRLNLYH